MEEYIHAHKVFRPEWGTPYANQEFVHEIEVFRKSFNGVLFIDRVLRALGITKCKPISPSAAKAATTPPLTNPASLAKSYPPKGERGLYDLHQQICDSRSAVHHKLSVFYYILLDFDTLGGRTNYAENYAFHFSVPEKYKLFMKGLWQLDHQQFSVRSPVLRSRR